MDIVARCELASRSGLEADKFVNTFAVTQVADDDLITSQVIANAFRDFYIAIPTGGLAKMGEFLSAEVDHVGGLTIKLYDATGKLAGGPANPLGSPYYVHPPVTLPDPGGGGSSIPSEVAVCITLEGTGRAAAQVEAPDGGDAGAAVDRPKQRHTGRIFFGPLTTWCLVGVAGQIRPDENILDTARLAIKNLSDDLDVVDTGFADLAVWSRKNAAMYPLEAVSVDNSFDTVRSRGNSPTIRQRTAV